MGVSHLAKLIMFLPFKHPQLHFTNCVFCDRPTHTLAFIIHGKPAYFRLSIPTFFWYTRYSLSDTHRHICCHPFLLVSLVELPWWEEGRLGVQPLRACIIVISITILEAFQSIIPLITYAFPQRALPKLIGDFPMEEKNPITDETNLSDEHYLPLINESPAFVLLG